MTQNMRKSKHGLTSTGISLTIIFSEKLLEISWTPGSFHMLRPAAVVPLAPAAAEVAEEVAAETRR